MFNFVFLILSSMAFWYSLFTLLMSDVVSLEDEKSAFWFASFISVAFAVSAYFLLSP